MKVLQIIPNLQMGGAEIMCETLTKALINNNHDVVVVSLYNEKTPISLRLEQSNVKVIYLNKHKGFDLSCILSLRRVICKEKPDIIHTHLYALKYAAIASVFVRIKIIHTIHNIASKETNRINQLFNFILFHSQKSIPIALSNEVKNTIIKIYHIHSNIDVISNGVNLNNVIAKDKYSLNNSITILNIARFDKQKNHIRLVDAFSAFHRLYQNSVLVLIGDGYTKEEVILHVKKLGLTNNVIFEGCKDNVMPYYNAADMFVMSSDYEGMPMTIIEAMATGLPIISTDVGGIHDMISDNESGLLCGTDSNMLFKLMVRCVKDDDLRAKIGFNAKIASKAFSSIAMADKYIDIYYKWSNL